MMVALTTNSCFILDRLSYSDNVLAFNLRLACYYVGAGWAR